MKKMMMTAAAILALAGMNLQTASAGVPLPPPPFVFFGGLMAGAAATAAAINSQPVYTAPAPVYYGTPAPAYCPPQVVYAPPVVYAPRYAYAAPAPFFYAHWGWHGDHYRGYDRNHYQRR